MKGRVSRGLLSPNNIVEEGRIESNPRPHPIVSFKEGNITKVYDR